MLKSALDHFKDQLLAEQTSGGEGQS